MAGLINEQSNANQLYSASTTETNLKTTNVFNTFAMDDPCTPLHIPVCNFYDQELQTQDTDYNNMLTNNTTVKLSTEDPSIELPPNLFDILENVHFDIEEFSNGHDFFNSMALLDAEVTCQTRLNNNRSDELVTPQRLNEHDDIINPSVSSFPSANNNLHLDVNTHAADVTAEHVTTPEVIKMIFEVENKSLEDSPAVKRKRNSSRSDLRRVRNNEASRKSRQNRRQKQQSDAQRVVELEEQAIRLNLKIKELEKLKAEILKYVTAASAY